VPVEHFRFELAIVGIMMPGMSGIELADRLRQQLLNCKILLMDGNELVESVKPHRLDFDLGR
jgi:CheY-like chemotaxis protein